MMTRRVFVAALLFAAPTGLVAHPGHDHKVMGTIAVVDGSFVTITTTDGKELTFEVTDATRLLKGKGQGARGDLKAGLRVVANVGDGEEPLKAKEVQYAAAAADRQSR